MTTTIPSPVTAPHAFVDFDADAWELYTIKEGSEVAAATLTAKFNEFAQTAFLEMSQGGLKIDVMREFQLKMEAEMQILEDFGAYDSEPLRKLECAMEAVFNPESAPRRRLTSR